jgi:hypothetical protein
MPSSISSYPDKLPIPFDLVYLRQHHLNWLPEMLQIVQNVNICLFQADVCVHTQQDEIQPDCMS